ncbi:MAG TPA: hypothetical protein VJV74_08285, partial [Terriglobia bacterium]|nr:hypothetical protein [Terriglobia bacterium]
WLWSDWRRRRGLIFGLTAVFAVLIAASELVLPGWIRLWLNALLDYRHYTQPPLLPLVFGSRIGLLLALVLLGVACAWGWRSRKARTTDAEFGLMLSFVLALTVIALPMGDAVYEHILLVPGLLMIYLYRHQLLQSSGLGRWLTGLLLVVLFWQWVAACGVVIAGVLAPSLLAGASTILLPLRLAAPLPFLVVALLGFLIVPRLAEHAASPSPESH